MPATAPRLVAATAAVRSAGAPAGPLLRSRDPLDADRVDFDAWLLPPAEVDGVERLVQQVSRLAGPVTLIATAGIALWALA